MIFSAVFFKIISILLSVIVGFLAGRLVKVERDNIAHLLFYFIGPIIFFASAANIPLKLSNITITLTVFSLCCLMGTICYYGARIYWQDNHVNILAFSGGTANSGYFLLPIATLIFDEQIVSIYMMCVMGLSIYESTLGFYFCTQDLPLNQILLRLIRLPNLNAFVLGLMVSMLGITIPEFLDDFLQNMRATYSILGMVMIGLGLSSITKFEIDLKFTVFAVGSKILLQPLVINSFILLDRWAFHFYDQNYYYPLQLLSTAPMAANSIVMASLVKIHPEKVVTAVMISALIDLFYVPTIVSTFLVL